MKTDTSSLADQTLSGKSISLDRLVWVCLLAILALNFAIRWHLQSIPLERDEGEYAYAGQLLLEGIPPYKLVWNMKFPGVYFAYAGLMFLFGESPQGIHTGMILITSLSTVLMFFIGRKLMNPAGGLITAALFVVLSALPQTLGLAGHAAHFVVLFACLGTLGLLAKDKQKRTLYLLLSGMAFGTAILMKQHAIIFAFAALLGLAWSTFGQGKKAVIQVGVFLGGIGIPLLLTFALLAEAGVWNRFYFWTIQYARQYVSIIPLRSVPAQFVSGFGPILYGGIWVWLTGAAGLSPLFLKAPYRRAAMIALGLFLTGLLAAFPGFYFRGHYFLMVMPGLALLNAVSLLAVADWVKKSPKIRLLKFLPICLFCVIVGDVFIRNAATWFSLTPLEVSRKLYGHNPFAASPKIAGYLAAHSKPDDTIAVLGSEPEIFFLAHRHSATGYIYVYPLTEPQPLAEGMRKEFIDEIESAGPAYVVYINMLSSWRGVNVPGETERILNGFNRWWDDYSKKYRLVGQVDLAENGPSDFFWGKQLLNRTNQLPADISIFHRE